MSKPDKRYCFDWKRIQFKDIYHIEYSVTDICNRNCKACSHLAPLAKDPNFVSVEEFMRVVKIMRKCVPDAHTVWITGGEPTLHPQYLVLLDILRNVFTDNFVGIYTNGVTLSESEHDENFWRFVRDNGIVWAVTPYDTPQSYFEKLFDAHGCLNNLAIVHSGKLFFKLTAYSKARPVTEEKYKLCGWERSKLNIRNGKIYNCSASEFADLFSARFGTELEVSSRDFLTADETLTRARIDAFKGPIPFCRQCDITVRRQKPFLNVPSQRQAEEWSESNHTEEVG